MKRIAMTLVLVGLAGCEPTPPATPTLDKPVTPLPELPGTRPVPIQTLTVAPEVPHPAPPAQPVSQPVTPEASPAEAVASPADDAAVPPQIADPEAPPAAQ